MLPVSLRALQQEVFDHAKQWLEALPVYARVSIHVHMYIYMYIHVCTYMYMYPHVHTESFFKRHSYHYKHRNWCGSD